MATVISTLTCNFTFVKYHDLVPGQQIPRAHRRIRIFGGANRPGMKGYGDMTTDNEGVPLWTAAGFSTQVSDEDMKWLSEDPSFKAFVAGGNLKVLEGDKRDISHDKIKRIVAAEMAAGDSHAPMTRNDPRRGNAKLKVISAADNDDI